MRTSSAIKLVNTNDPVYNKLTVGEGGNRTPTRTSVSRLADGRVVLISFFTPCSAKSRDMVKEIFNIESL